MLELKWVCTLCLFSFLLFFWLHILKNRSKRNEIKANNFNRCYTVYEILSMNRFYVVYHRSQNLFMLRFVFNLPSFSGYYNNNKYNALIKFDCTDFFLLCVLFHLWSFCDSVTLTFLNQYLSWVNTVDVFLYFYSKKDVSPDKMFLINFPFKIFINCSSIFYDDAREEFSIFNAIIY